MNKILESSQEELRAFWEEGLYNHCFHEDDLRTDQIMLIKKGGRYYLLNMINFKHFLIEVILKQEVIVKKEYIEEELRELQLQLDNADNNYKGYKQMQNELTNKVNYYDNIINGCVVRCLMCQREDTLEAMIIKHKNSGWHIDSTKSYAWDELGEDVFSIDMIKDLNEFTKIQLNKIKLNIDRWSN